jgi:hypothetical protein
VPFYYFEAEGQGWSDYQDGDGIELQSDTEALAYAYSMIRELKATMRAAILLAKNCIRKTSFRIAFE